MTTNTTQFVIMDRINGWRESTLGIADERLDFSPAGDRRLFGLPGRASLLLDADLQQQTLVCPSAVSVRNNGKVAVVDAATNKLTWIDIDKRSAETVGVLGGKGNKGRRCMAPRGITVQKSGSIIISDTANHRVLIFSETQHALVQSWGAVDRLGRPVPGNGNKTFRFPWAVAADGCGVIYVVDRGNHHIQKIASDGTWLGEIGRPHLIEPTRIALGKNGLIGVVDPLQQAVLIFSPARNFPRALTNIQDVRSLTFDNNGKLYVADAHGLIEVYAPENGNKGDTYRLVGQGHTGIEGEIIDLDWVSASGGFLLAIIKENFNGLRQRLWRIEVAGTFKRDGRLITTALDSRLEKCQWHRVSLKATIPVAPTWPTSPASPKTDLGAGSIEVESYTSDEVHKDDWIPPESSWKRCVLSGDSDPDCLVQSGRGRFLWLRLTLRSNGIDTPILKSIKAFFPRTSYLQYLPAVYQEDDESRLFLERFLSIFQTEFDNFDQQLDRMWQLFDPASISETHFDWLAGWLALVIQPESLVEQRHLQCQSEGSCQPRSECAAADDTLAVQKSTSNLDWTMNTKRQMLANAFRKYRERGTVRGIEQLIKDYTGVQFATIVEHFRLRRWPILSVIKEPTLPVDDHCVVKKSPTKGTCGEDVTDYRMSLPLDGTLRLWSRDFYKRLQLTSYSQVGSFRLTGTPEPVIDPLDWGAHRFTVFFPASPYDVEQAKQKVGQVVEREKPAHTQAELCPVLPRLRVGVQATVGADAMVGGISHLVLNSLSTLNYDAILACGNEDRQLRALGTSRQPRAGMTAKLS